MNIVTLIGVIVDSPILREFDSGARGSFITLKVARPFKSMDGNFEFDYIKCCLWEGIAQNTCEYCTKGDTIAIRGRLATYSDEIKVSDANGNEKFKKISTLQCIVERVSFISTSRRNKQYDPSNEPYQDLVEEKN